MSAVIYILPLVRHFIASVYSTAWHFSLTESGGFSEGDWSVWNFNLQPIKDDMENHSRTAIFISGSTKHPGKLKYEREKIQKPRLLWDCRIEGDKSPSIKNDVCNTLKTLCMILAWWNVSLSERILIILSSYCFAWVSTPTLKGVLSLLLLAESRSRAAAPVIAS